jgi:hypothetical protein
MLLKELDSRFSVLFEDLNTSGSKGLDSYERSICLTYAQKEIIKALAQSGNLRPISKLVKYGKEITYSTSVYYTAREYNLITKFFHILGYFIKSQNGRDIPLVEVPEQVISEMLAGSYKYPPKNLAYVVMGENTATVFPPFNFNVSAMYTKYVAFPSPVILENLSGSDAIDGVTTATEPILDESFHEELVNAAVQYAIKVYIGQEEKDLGADDSRGN